MTDKNERFREIPTLCKLTEIRWSPLWDHYEWTCPGKLVLGQVTTPFGPVLVLGLKIRPNEEPYPLVICRINRFRIELIPGLLSAGPLFLEGNPAEPYLANLEWPQDFGEEWFKKSQKVVDPQVLLADAGLMDMPDVAIDLDEEGK